MKEFLKYLFLIMFGGSAYCVVEILFRGYTYFSMFIVGGICFLICGSLNEVCSWDVLLWHQMLACSIMITVIEYIAGMFLNVALGLEIWDYSNMPLNLNGQICVPFMIAWFALSAVGIILDDYLRYWIFKEEKPHYVLWRKNDA